MCICKSAFYLAFANHTKMTQTHQKYIKMAQNTITSTKMPQKINKIA